MGGSGGSSGKVDFPEYLKDTHDDWLTKNRTYVLSATAPCMTTVLSTALSSSPPQSSQTAFDPDDFIDMMLEHGSYVQNLANALSSGITVADILTDIDNSISNLESFRDDLNTSVTIGTVISGLLGTRTLIQNKIDSLNSAAPIGTTVGSLLTVNSSFTPIVENVINPTYTDNVIAEYEDELSNRLNTKILPRFNAGMRNIGAVVSSAFAIGQGVIEAEQERELGSFGAQLYLKRASDDALNLIGKELEFQRLVSDNLVKLIETNLGMQQSGSTLISDVEDKILKLIYAANTSIDLGNDELRMKLLGLDIETQNKSSALNTEIAKLGIIAKKEETEANNELEVDEALWDLEVFQHGANLLAAIGSGTALTKNKPNKAGSALAGALSGAAMGAYSGGTTFSWPGAIVGGVLGGAAGYLSA